MTEIIKFYLEDEEKSARKEVGQGFEVPLGSIWTEPNTKTDYKWIERCLVVKSYPLATPKIKGLHTRLEKGEKALFNLAQRPGNEEKVLQKKVEDILRNNRISKYIEYSIEKKISYDKVYQGHGSRSQSSSYKRVRKITLQLNYQRINAEIKETEMLAVVCDKCYPRKININRSSRIVQGAMARVKWDFTVLKKGVYRLYRFIFVMKTKLGG